MEDQFMSNPEELPFKVMTVQEITEEFDAYCAKMDAFFSYNQEEDVLTIKAAYNYEIELSRIRDYQDLLKWTLHLCEKRWVDKDLLREFVHRVCEFKGWDMFKPEVTPSDT